MTLTPTPVPFAGVPEHRHPLLPTPDELANLSKSLGLSTGPQVPTVIAPDDVATIGDASSGRAYGNHRHTFTAVAPSGLTRTATSLEGSSVNHPRADHTHATDQLGWGIVARHGPLTTSDSARATNVATDFTVTATFDSTRLYLVFVHSPFSLSAANVATIHLHQDGADYTRIERTNEASTAGYFRGFALYLPTSASHTLQVVNGSTPSLTLTASSVQQRSFFVLDIGLR